MHPAHVHTDNGEIRGFGPPNTGVGGPGEIFSKVPETNRELGQYAVPAFRVRILFWVSSTFSDTFWPPGGGHLGGIRANLGVSPRKLVAPKCSKWAEIGRYETIFSDSFTNVPYIAHTHPRSQKTTIAQRCSPPAH